MEKAARNRWGAFAGLLFWSLGLQGLFPGTIEPVKGGNLSLRLEVAGGQMRVTAGRWQELSAGFAGEAGGVRRLVAGSLRMVAEGNQRGDYSLLPLGNGGRWHERMVAELKLDEDAEWRLPPGFEKLDPRDLWETVPLRVELRPQPDGGWMAFLRTRDLLLPGGTGEVRRHRAGSIWNERMSRHPLHEGSPATEVKTRSQPRDIPLNIQFGEGVRSGALWHSNLYPPSLSFCREEGLPVTVSGPGRMRSSGTLEEVSLARLEPASEGGFGGSKVRFTWDLRLGEPPDVGWWEPAGPGLEAWLPECGKQLVFQVMLSRVDAVESLRFVLRETTRHPGVAVNAWHAHLSNQVATATGRGEVAVTLPEGASALAWKRHYPVAAATPLDSFPDLHFEQSRNPSARVEGEILTGQAEGLRGTELRFEKVAARVAASLTVADWAAAGVLGVQAKIDGLWEDLQAKGPGVEADGLAIRFPLDANRDGLPDTVPHGSPGMDDGDGLDEREEYRGVLVGGRHLRLDPAQRDLFLIDYGQTLSEASKGGVAAGLAKLGLQAHWIGLAEHRDERIGKAAAIVIENLKANALPLILGRDDPAEQVRAWSAIRPRPGLGMVFVEEQTEAGCLVVDLGKVLASKGKGEGK